MPDLDTLILTEPDAPEGVLASTRTLREDVAACIEGFRWVAFVGRPRRVYDASDWTAHAVLDGDIIARGTVGDVRIDERTDTATLDVDPPARVFPVTSRAES